MLLHSDLNVAKFSQEVFTFIIGPEASYSELLSLYFKGIFLCCTGGPEAIRTLLGYPTFHLSGYEMLNSQGNVYNRQPRLYLFNIHYPAAGYSTADDLKLREEEKKAMTFKSSAETI